MSFAVHADTWLSEVMHRPAFRVDWRSESNGRAELGPGFYFAKVPTDRIADARALAKLGFFVVDTNLTFELTRDPVAPTGIEVGDMAAAEADAVVDIAGTAFRHSRFHLDPDVGPELANRIKREWVRNCVDGKRGDGLLVARQRGQVCGFLAPLITDDGDGSSAVVDLVAVAPDARGRGTASGLVAAFANRYRGMPRLVGTQLANLPSIRLYTKLGFALARSQYVLHLHV